MVTKGEWALKHLDVTVKSYNKTTSMENSVSYKVRKKKTKHFLPHDQR